jgi:phosphoglucosamine mutase
MGRKYFGTDGVRGRVGEAPMTADFAVRLANAAARVLAPEGGTALIGKDTRVSGYLFESALEAGFVAAGVDVMLTGPLPTPGIAYLTSKLPRTFGVVISASHNPYEDNGIKFFDASGAKLSDELEERIEAEMERGVLTQESNRLGRARRGDSLREDYQAFCAASVPGGLDLTGMKIVIDCANGAGYKVGPRLLADLGADIIPIGCSPNGRNINDGCGSTSPELLQLTVPGVGAAVGIALDGDGDRLVMVDNLGRVLDGDQLLYIIARARQQAGALQGPVVGTVMSNLGLEIALGKLGIAFRRARVGDRNVLTLLKEQGGVIGGETSGHILCLDRATTGDALVSALQVLEVMHRSGRTLAQLATDMTRFPQVLLNVPVARRYDPETVPAIREAVARVEARLAGEGRVVLRPSGTEPVIRVMVEGRDERETLACAELIAAAVRAAGDGAPNPAQA